MFSEILLSESQNQMLNEILWTIWFDEKILLIYLHVICLQQTVAKVAPVVETRPRFPQNPLPFFMDWSDAFVAIANLVADGILTQS